MEPASISAPMSSRQGRWCTLSGMATPPPEPASTALAATTPADTAPADAAPAKSCAPSPFAPTFPIPPSETAAAETPDAGADRPAGSHHEPPLPARYEELGVIAG